MNTVTIFAEVEAVGVEGHQGFISRTLYHEAHKGLTIRLLNIEPGGKGPVPAHRHEAVHFFLVMEGILEMDMDGRKHRVPAGSFLQVEPGIKHQLHGSGETPVVVLALKSEPGSGHSK